MTTQDTSLLTHALLGGQVSSRAIELDLETLKGLYNAAEGRLGSTVGRVDVVLLGDSAYFRFTDLSPQHYLITGAQGPLYKEDFEFAKEAHFYGATRQLPTLKDFLWGEIRLNRWLLILISIVSTVVLAWINDDNLNIMINELILTSGTIFVTMFSLFTVFSIRTLQTDIRLYSTGFIHEFMRYDKYVVLLAVATILLAILNVGLVKVPTNAALTLQWIPRSVPVGLAHHSVPILTALALAMLVDCLVSIPSYYFERMRTVVDMDMANRILTGAGAEGKSGPPNGQDELGRDHLDQA